MLVLWLPAASGTPLPPAVAQALADARIPQAAVSLVVRETGAATPRLQLNAGQARNPASLMKLVTTFAGLELLGPAYTWKTTAWTSAQLADGVLDGDLMLKGGGDPKLTIEQFWLLLRQLRARGVREITGDLMLDRSGLAPIRHDPAAFDDQPLRPYNVGPDPLLLNFNTIRLTLVPPSDADAVGAQVQTLAEPAPANLDILNRLKPTAGGCGDWREQLRADPVRQGGRWQLTLSGGFPTACGERNWNLSPLPHTDYLAGVFSQIWTELGGRWQGGVRSGRVPPEARQLAAIESPPLAEVIRDINKYSNNVMARQLYLSLGANGPARPASTAEAEATLRAWLIRRGLDMPELVLDNGSGLSREGRASAASLERLLQAAWQSPLMPEFVASLPLVAVDGTMKKRLNGNGVAGHAHIKTGSLEGVKTIAGYVQDRQGHWQTVVVLVNHANAQAAQAAMDALLAWVYAADVGTEPTVFDSRNKDTDFSTEDSAQTPGLR